VTFYDASYITVAEADHRRQPAGQSGFDTHRDQYGRKNQGDLGVSAQSRLNDRIHASGEFRIPRSLLWRNKLVSGS
jgi:hypothetical protein